MGAYAMALWLMVRSQALSTLADPALDTGALEIEIRSAQLRSVRKPSSVLIRLQNTSGTCKTHSCSGGVAATLTLGALAGIQVAETGVIALPDSRQALAVKRFDRAHSQRLHAMSAHVVLRAAGEPMGYPELHQWLRRHAPASGYRAQMA